MGNCADLEIDEDELQEKVVIIDGLTIKEFEKQENALNTEEESCDGDLGGEEEEGKEEESKEEKKEEETPQPIIEDAPAPMTMMTTDDAPQLP